jgi:hypothetical protein
LSAASADDGRKTDHCPESRIFLPTKFRAFTNQECTHLSSVIASSSRLGAGQPCPAPFCRGRWDFQTTPAKSIHWERQRHVCRILERHRRMDGSAGVAAVATDHTGSSRNPMRGMPPASISLRVRGRADVVPVRGSSPPATQPETIRRCLTPDILAPAAISRKTHPIWREFPLRVPLDYVRCPFPA